MSVQRKLKLCAALLESLAKQPDVIKICGYSAQQVRWFSCDGIGKALKLYQREAARKKAAARRRGL